jgi:hypothetical protein
MHDRHEAVVLLVQPRDMRGYGQLRAAHDDDSGTQRPFAAIANSLSLIASLALTRSARLYGSCSTTANAVAGKRASSQSRRADLRGGRRDGSCDRHHGVTPADVRMCAFERGVPHGWQNSCALAVAVLGSYHTGAFASKVNTLYCYCRGGSK